MTQNATQIQTPESYQANSLSQRFKDDHSQAAVSAPLQRPVPGVRQQVQAQRTAAVRDSAVPNPAHYQGAQPQPVQPGGDGPLSGYASGVSTDPQPQLAPQVQDSVPINTPHGPIPGGSAEAFAAQAFAYPPRRPSFPAAPSKVLAEQQALGGDGHIRDTEPVPAFDVPLEGPYLEGAYPAPHARPATAQPGGRAMPRYQHRQPPSSIGRAPYAEPTLNEPSLDQSRADANAAFWDTAGTAPAQENSRWGALVALLFAVVLLLGLLAFAAWSQLRTAPVTPIRLTPESGPEWMVPADPGGLQIKNQDIGVLNPDEIQPDGTLTTVPISPSQPVPPVDGDLATDDEVEVSLELEVSIPTVSPAEASSGTNGSTNVTATPNAPQPVAVPSAPAQTQPAPSGAVAAESGVITVPPTGLYVQEGAYSTLVNAQSAFRTVQAQGGSTFADITPLYHATPVNGTLGYKLYLIGFDSSLDAQLAGVAIGRNAGNWFIRNG